jgi:hypothetical protein
MGIGITTTIGQQKWNGVSWQLAGEEEATHPLAMLVADEHLSPHILLTDQNQRQQNEGNPHYFIIIFIVLYFRWSHPSPISIK